MRARRRLLKGNRGTHSRPSFAIHFALLLTFAGTAWAQEGYKIRSIAFQGNATFSSDDLAEKMTQKGRGWFAEHIQRQEVYDYDEELLRKDLEALVRFYQAEGFLNVRIEPPRLERDDADRTVGLRIVIDEGRAVFVRRLEQVVEADSTVAPLLRKFAIEQGSEAPLEVGARFRDEAARQQRRALLDHLSESGYPYATVEHRLQVTAPRDSVDVTWRIAAGPRCEFGPATIRGNERIASHVIARRIAFEAGERYDGSKLADSQRYVYSLGQFSVVSFKPVLSEDRAAVVPIDVKIQEAPRTKATFGAGYGMEDKFRGVVEVERLGFLNGARRASLYAKHSSLEPINLSLSLVQSDFPLTKFDFVLRPYYLRQDEPGYSVDRNGANVSLERNLSTLLYGSLTYTLENVELTSAADDPTETTAAEEDSLYDKSSLSFAITRQTGQPIFDPLRGSFHALRATYSGLPPSRYEYIKLIWDSRRYDAIRRDLVLASRFKVGYIESFDDDAFVPVEERFTSGGSNSVRGWERSTLGPLDPAGKPLGGNSLLEGSFELRWQEFWNASPVVLFDLGNVWEPTGTYKLDELEYSAGFGLRYPTVIGPVRLDVAKPVFGEDLPTQWHFSIGQAF